MLQLLCSTHQACMRYREETNAAFWRFLKWIWSWMDASSSAPCMETILSATSLSKVLFATFSLIKHFITSCSNKFKDAWMQNPSMNLWEDWPTRMPSRTRLQCSSVRLTIKVPLWNGSKILRFDPSITRVFFFKVMWWLQAISDTDERFQQRVKGVRHRLVIKKVEKGDQGVYSCELSNKSSSARLFVSR